MFEELLYKLIPVYGPGRSHVLAFPALSETHRYREMIAAHRIGTAPPFPDNIRCGPPEIWRGVTLSRVEIVPRGIVQVVG